MVATELVCASAISTTRDSREALTSVCEEVAAALPNSANLAFLFLSAQHAVQSQTLASEAGELLGTDNVLGCTGESIVGTGTEVEGSPAISLWAACLPAATIVPMHLEYQQTPEGGSVVGWPDDLPEPWPSDAALLLLGDPFSFPADVLVERLHQDRPGIPVAGGMASAAGRPGENRLLWGGKTYDAGAVAVLVQGGLHLRTIVSQGCRPVGSHFVITKAERNVIYELGGAPAFQRLKEVYLTLATHEQAMLQRGLHLGRVVNEYQDQFGQGDFLVRNVMGIDQETGSISIGDFVRPGQTVQFHLRDADTADAELRQLLAKVRDDSDSRPRGALLFTCNGRGTRLFAEPHHDAAAIQQTLGDIPLAGFFAAGEIGPVGGRSFMHGFTASIALFAAPRMSPPAP
jgi:small ligand-binding sensory domain FIST